MCRVKLMCSNDQTSVEIDCGLLQTIEKCCRAVLELEGFEDGAEISLTFVNDEQIRSLNRDFRNKDCPTDVLSFPLSENGAYDVNPDTNDLLLGDIVISAETAVRQAQLYGHTAEREFCFLTVHSMLHLLGYDHEESELAEKEMRRKEEAALDSLGITRSGSDVPEHFHK